LQKLALVTMRGGVGATRPRPD